MKIFISYRREDTLAISGRLSDRLAVHFGNSSIFRDIDSIPLGSDFVNVMQREIAECDVVLAIIGTRWSRRLREDLDFVRIELEVALDSGIPIVPVLAEGARIPSSAELPESLADLARRQAIAIDSGRDFHRDVDVLIRAVERLAARSRNPVQSPVLDPSDLRGNQVFVCHATADRPWVELEVVKTLEHARVGAWYSKVAIKTAAQWEREILRGLESSDWFLIVVSPRAADSEWVKDELFWAMQYRLTRIIPVIMESCDLYKFHIRLARIQNIDFTADVSEAKRQLVAAVAG